MRLSSLKYLIEGLIKEVIHVLTHLLVIRGNKKNKIEYGLTDKDIDETLYKGYPKDSFDWEDDDITYKE